MNRKPFIRFIRRSISLLSCLLLTLILFLFLLPTLVSLPMVTSRLEIAAGNTLGRPVSFKALEWSWLDGLSLSDLEITEDPRFGDQPLLRLNTLSVSYTLAEVFSDTLALKVELSGLRGRMITDDEGRNNIDTLLSGLAGADKAAKEKQPAKGDEEKPFALPLDVQAVILLQDINFEMSDAVQNRRLSVEDFSFHLNIPSLLHQPIVLDINAPLVRVNENTLEPISFHFFLTELFQSDTRLLTPFNTQVLINGHLPGLEIDVHGGPLAQGLSGKVTADLAAVLSSFKPFVPPAVPEVSGLVTLDLKGDYDPKNSDPLNLTLSLSGDSIAVTPSPPTIPQLDTDFYISLAAGGSLEELLRVDLQLKVNELTAAGAPLPPQSKIGPLNLALQQNIVFDQQKDRLRIETGRMQIAENNHLEWEAEISGLQNERAIQFSLNKLHFDPTELLTLAAPWIPDAISLTTDKQGSVLEISGLRFKGDISGGPGDVDLEEARMALAGLHIQQAGLDIHAHHFEIGLEELTTSLENNFPTSLTLSLGAVVDGFRMTGNQEVAFENLAIHDVRLSAQQLAPAPLSPYGLQGMVFGGQHLLLKGLRVPGQLAVPEFSETIRLETILGEDGDAALTLHELAIRFPSFTLMGLPTPEGNNTGQLTTSLAADLKLEQILVPQGEVLKTQARGIGVKLKLGDMFDFDFQGSLDELGTKELHAELGGQINLREATTVADALLPPGLHADGNISFHGVSTGRVPLPTELQVLNNQDLSLLQRFSDLSFAQHGLFTLELDDIDLNLPDSGERQIRIRGTTTATPLTLELGGADKRLSFSGRVEIPEIRQVPLTEDMPEQLAVNLEFSGTTANLHFLDMEEKFDLQPLGIQQALQVRVEHIDDLLDSELPLSPVTALRKLHLAIHNHLELERKHDAQPVTSTINLGGSLTADMGLEMRGGEHSAFGLNFLADRLHFAMRDKLELNGLDADFQFDKSYRLTTATREDRPQLPPPLSLEVLESASSTGGARDSETKTFVERFRRDTKLPRPTLAFQSFRLLGDAPRIEVTDSTLNLAFVDSLPFIDNLELNLLGGTVLCSLDFSEQESRYGMALNVAFSGIDAGRMLPNLQDELPSSETEISGRVEVETPLSSEPDKLLEDFNLRLHISHIGQKMLSRLLYGLDPHESNEAIVKQRKMVELGSPRWIMVTIENGNLSLRGEVTIKGVAVALPELKRINVSGLPIEDELRGALAGLADLEKGLNFLQADTLVIEEGKITPLPH